MTKQKTLDPEEIAQFARIADEWWDEGGKFKPLHKINPTRLAYLREQICRFYGREVAQEKALDGLSIVDIGCGGGLVSEPLARQGAKVTGVDPGAANIAAAKHHAAQHNVSVTYLAQRAEELAERGEQFDVVLALEVLEHIPDVPAFTKVIAQLLKPGGLMIVSTINRNWKSYAMAIVGAEYILRWLPKGTHQWERFITLEEMNAALQASSLQVRDQAGMILHPLKGWTITNDTDVNYFMTASKPTAQTNI